MADKKHTIARFPLSYNPIGWESLSSVLREYEGRHHEEIVRDFEDQLKRLMDTTSVVALQSGTAAMHLALKVVGVKPGDYVIAPTFAYVATVAPVVYLGANLVLVDSEMVTWNIDPELTIRAIKDLLAKGKRVAAIVVVHNYGVPANVREVIRQAKEYSIPVIEDAAESFGSKIGSKWAGTMGDVGVFSFNSNKTLTGHGGGALVSSNQEYVDRARYLAAHARSNKPYYEHLEVGYNYRMSPLLAANVISQLRQLAGLLDHRKAVFHAYESLGTKLGLSFQKALPGDEFQPWLMACRFQAKARPDQVSLQLMRFGMETRQLWNPMHRQPAFRGSTVYGGSVAQALFDSGICLPSALNLHNLMGEATEVLTRLATTLR